MVVEILITVVVTLVIAIPVTALLTTKYHNKVTDCLLYTSPSPRDA